MAKYRNRMVHFYDEITEAELHGIIAEHLDDFQKILGTITSWLAELPDRAPED